MIILRNEKGFSLIEMLAVILIASTVLLPLLVGLTGNIRVNDNMINRSISTSIASTTLQVFDTMYFQDIEQKFNENGGGVILEFDSESGCELLLDSAPLTDFYEFLSNRFICEQIFEAKIVNRSFTSEQFKVFVYPFIVENTSAFETAINSTDIPEPVRERIIDEVTGRSDRLSGRTFRILSVLVWINYGDNENQYIIRTGLIAPTLELD